MKRPLMIVQVNVQFPIHQDFSAADREGSWWSSRVDDTASHQNLKLFSRGSNQDFLFGGYDSDKSMQELQIASCNISTIYFIQPIY